MDAAAEFRTLFHGSASSGGGAGLFLIRRPDRWEREWQYLYAGDSDVPPLPPVDLERETIIVLAAGGRPTLGYDVTIHRVEVHGRTLVVTATEIRPTGVTLQAISSPVHLVAVRIGTRPYSKVQLNLLIEHPEDEY